jgi:hypothetical protein
MLGKDEVARHMEIMLTSHDNALRTASHTFLLNFQNSPEAWPICRELLVPSSSPSCLFLSAQLLYSKIKSEFNTLTEAQKQELSVYLYNLVKTGLNNPQAHKKLCEALTLVGLLTMNSLWEKFLSDILMLGRPEITLEVLDCLPYCIEEFCMSKKTKAMLKTKILDKAGQIMDYFMGVVTNRPECSLQVLEVIKNWKSMKLPILQHSQLITWLLQIFNLIDDNFPSACDVLLDAVNCSSTSFSLQELGLSSNYWNVLPETEKVNISNLISVIITDRERILSHEDEVFKKKGCELLTGICTSLMWITIEDTPTSQELWNFLIRILLNDDFSLAVIFCDFWQEFKETALKSIKDMSSRLWLLQIILNLSGLLASRCCFSSPAQYLELVSSKDSEETTLIQYRINAEDIFLSSFLIYDTYAEGKGSVFLQNVASIILPPVDPMKAEVFMFIMKSLIPSLTEKQNQVYLREVIYYLGSWLPA